MQLFEAGRKNKLPKSGNLAKIVSSDFHLWLLAKTFCERKFASAFIVMFINFIRVDVKFDKIWCDFIICLSTGPLSPPVTHESACSFFAAATSNCDNLN